MSGARRRALAWLGLVSALAACSHAPEPPPAPPRALVRLWRDQAPSAQVSSATAGADGATRLQCRFDGTDDVAWQRVVPAPHPDDGFVMQPDAPGSGALELGSDDAPAELTRLTVRAGEALSLRVTARAVGATDGNDVPLAVLVELPKELDTTRLLSVDDIAHLLDPNRHATHTLRAPLGAAASSARLDFVVERNSTELVVYLVAPIGKTPAAIVVERVAVVERSLGDHVGEGGEFPQLTRLEQPGSVRLALDRDMREGVLALPGTSTTWTLPPCAGERRLELSLGVAPRAGDIDGAIRLAVSAGGETLLDERLLAPGDASQPAWHDRVLRLPASPGAPLSLEFGARGEGRDPPLAVFGHPTVSIPRAVHPPNVVLISLDTLRPDRLGCYGGDASISPHIDALAAEGLRFANAYSTSSYTLPSHGSMLTGTYPAFHGAVDVSDALDPRRSPFLARMLADAGYQTAGFTGGGYVSVTYGFGEGFDRYSHNDPVWALDSVRGQQLIETMSWERAPAQAAFLTRYATPSVVEWLEQRDPGTPFFAFLHTYIAHNYAPDTEWLGRRGLLGKDGHQDPFNHQERVRFNEGEAELRDTVYGEYMPYYDATIGMADEFVGAVLDALDRVGLADDTIVIVTSDHGEEFGEHAFFGHGESLYAANTHVPLIARLPAALGRTDEQPAVEELPVSLVDIAPWVLRLVGLEPDPHMAIAPPLGPTRSDPPGRDSLFIELDTKLNGVRRLTVRREGRWELHRLLEGEARGIEPGGVRLFDTEADPGETHDLAAANPDVVARLSRRIDQLHELAEAVHPRDDSAPLDLLSLDPDVIDSLIQLGYISAEQVEAARRAGGR